MKGNAKVGDLVEVDWLDAQGFYNTALADVKPARTKNIGILVEIRAKYIVLQTGLYLDDIKPNGDYTAIPRGGWLSAIKVIKKGAK